MCKFAQHRDLCTKWMESETNSPTLSISTAGDNKYLELKNSFSCHCKKMFFVKLSNLILEDYIYKSSGSLKSSLNLNN